MRQALLFRNQLALARLFPGFQQLIISNGFALRLLVCKLGLGCAWLVQPVLRIARLIQLRTTGRLDIGALEALHDTILSLRKTIKGFLRSSFATGCLSDVLPPQLGQLRIVRYVGTSGRPLNARRAAIELNKTTELGSHFSHRLRLDIGFPDRSQTGNGFF